MAKQTVFTCDVCSHPKLPSNGWSMARVSAGSVTILKWNEKQTGVKHLCSVPCEIKFIASITETWRNNDRGTAGSTVPMETQERHEGTEASGSSEGSTEDQISVR